jgi:hypothetical protein
MFRDNGMLNATWNTCQRNTCSHMRYSNFAFEMLIYCISVTCTVRTALVFCLSEFTGGLHWIDFGGLHAGRG